MDNVSRMEYGIKRSTHRLALGSLWQRPFKGDGSVDFLLRLNVYISMHSPVYFSGVFFNICCCVYCFM